MKKMLMIACAMFMSVGVFAQNEVGQITLQPKAGINLSTVTGDGDQKMKVGLVAGVEGEYGIAEKFGVTAGVLYSMEGCKEDGVNINLDYINIPIMAQYYPIQGLAIKAGIQPGFNVRKKATKDGNSKTLDGVKGFNFSIPVGLSYEISNFVIDARYNIGVTKLYKDADQGRNSTISFTVGYKFAL